MSIEINNELIIDLNRSKSMKSIPPKYNEIILTNSNPVPLNETTIFSIFKKIKNLNHVESLEIDPDSTISNLKILTLFQNIKSLNIYSQYLANLDGIEHFKGNYIQIDTDNKKRLDITGLSRTKITNLVMKIIKESDIDEIALCINLERILLTNCPNISFAKFKKVPLSLMQLWGGKLEVIEDTINIPTLETLTLGKNTKLQNFNGDNSNVIYLHINACNNLDLKTIGTFKNLKNITLESIKKNFSISDFQSLKKIESISLRGNCNVDIDINQFNMFKSLKKVLISNLKADNAKEMSNQNINILISNGSYEFINGKLIEN